MMRKLHRWLSLLLCVPLLWIATTGCLLAIVNLSSDRHPPFHENARSLRESLAKVALPLAGVKSVEWATPETLRIENKNGAVNLIDIAHPEVIKEAPHVSKEWLHTLMHLHRGQFMGDFGRYVFSTFGASLLFLAFSGTFLFRRRNRFMGARDYHQAGAWVLVIPLGLMVTTGSLWNLSREWRALPELAEASAFAPLPALAHAEQAYSRSTPQAVYSAERRTLVLFADQSRYYWDSASQTGDLRAVWQGRGWIEPLFHIHSGRWFGRYGVLIPLLTGFGALALTATGFILLSQWWRRL